MRSSEVLALSGRIDAWLAACPPGEAASAATAGVGTIDLQGLVMGKAWLSVEEIPAARLERIRRKVEVARKVYKRYTADFARPADGEPLSVAARQRLVAILLKVSLLGRDARYLNSALKLLDGLPATREPDRMATELVRLAHDVLDVLVPLEPAAS